MPKLIADLQGCEYVGEIIVIDNSGLYVPIYDKEIVYKPGRNIYVNPAWNLGVTMATFENVCICNDDVNFDTSVFEFMATRCQGVIGMDTDNYYNSGVLQISSITERNWGWGCVIFTTRSDYKMIPEQLLIACGDDYLIKHTKSYKLSGLRVITKVSTTSLSPEFLPIQARDKQIFDNL
jgi:hypothetical protein